MKQLPGSLRQELAREGVQDNSISAVCETDLDETERLVHGWVCLAGDTLWICRSLDTGHQTFFFSRKGEDRLAMKVARHQARDLEKVEEGEQTWQVDAVPVSHLGELSLRQQGRIGQLYLPGKDGRVLAFFTAGYMADMLQLVQAVKRQREPDHLPDERPGGMQEKRPDRKPGGTPGERPDRKPGGTPEKRPDRRPGGTPEQRFAQPDLSAGREPEGEEVPGRRPAGADNRHYMVRLLSYFRSQLPLVALSGLCYLLIAGLNIVWPYLNGTVLYDKVLAKDPAFLEALHLPQGGFAYALILVAVAMFVTELVQLFIRHVKAFAGARIVNRMSNEMKKDIFRKLEELSLNFFQNSQTGGLMVRVQQDADTVADFFSSDFPDVFIQGFTFITTAAVMLGLQWKLALVSLVAVPVVAWVSIKLKTRMHSLFGQRNRSNRRLTGLLNDTITGVRVVKAFGQEEQVKKSFDMRNQKVQKSEMDIVGYQNRFTALYTFAQRLVTLLVWAMGAWLVLEQNAMPYGLLITFASYVTQLNGPMEFLSRAFRRYEECMNSAGRMFEILDAVPQVKEPEKPVTLPQVRGHIELRNVEFGYIPNVPVFQDLSLDVPAGTTLGIVGRSGAGKSTLVNLISRLYDVWSGEILIDGVDIRQLSTAQLHGQVAMVSQETYIFMGTVAENIAYAKPDASMKEIIRAAKLASAHDFICKLPQGYDTVIGSSGASLSGGERQRLSIARAILADPCVLILDEATASVDTQTEQEIQQSLAWLSRNRTTLSIAHRLSTLRDADRLIVIEHGRIVEEGTHRELLDKKGTFYQLKELQTKALAMKGLE